MNNERLQVLFQRYLDQTASEEERAELMRLLAYPAHEDAVKDLVEQHWTNWPARQELQHEDASLLYQEIHNAVQTYEKQQNGKVVRMPWWKKAVAAAVLLVALGTAGWWFVIKRHTPQKDNITDINNRPPAEVPAPSANKALLTLADGSSIVLDSASNGLLARQGNIRVIKLADGQISYEGSGNEIVYNTLTNPRGSRSVNLTLTDGTRVWLNSESSLRFPAVFAGPDRRVEITGEAYFEVAKNTGKKFFVTVNGVTTEVLGTHFNINAYPEEGLVRVTLLEGKVNVSGGGKAQQLLPGEQAAVSPNGDIVLHNAVNTDQVMAWKNGYFSFSNSGLKTVMAEVARWYDLQVIYREPAPAVTFSGEIGRELTLNQVLSILAETRIKYRIEGKKLVILNGK